MQLNIRMEDPEERTSELEHKTIEMTPLEEQRKKRTGPHRHVTL